MLFKMKGEFIVSAENSTKKYEADFDFAKYMRDYWQLRSTLNPQNIGKVNVWQDICTHLCPGHQFDVIKETADNLEVCCTICGYQRDIYSDPDIEYTLLVKGCHNCKYLENDETPLSILHIFKETMICNCPEVNNLPEEDREVWTQSHMSDSKNCEHWSGKELLYLSLESDNSTKELDWQKLSFREKASILDKHKNYRMR